MSDDVKEMFKKKEKLTAWVSFNGGFETCFDFADNREFNKMLDAVKTRNYSASNPSLQEIYDDDLFVDELMKRIKGVRGLTLGGLAEMTSATLSDSIDPETEMKYDAENVRALLEEVWGYAAFCRDTMINIAVFRGKTLDGEKKTLPSTGVSESDKS